MTSNAVTKQEARTKPALPADIQARVDENRVRNMAIAAIRGTVWGKDLNAEQVRAVAQYCRENNLDAVRHVEVLGGRIYLTAELYDEKGAALIRDGVVQPTEPDYINADERLDKLAAAGDPWAKEEATRRLRARIQYNVPENARAAVVQRFRLTVSGAEVVGVNWCGGGVRQRDPVGDAEPTKTAATRARRRAWKQIADVIPAYAQTVRPLEASARIVSDEGAVAVIDAPKPKLLGAVQRADYGDQPAPQRVAVQPSEDPYEQPDASAAEEYAGDLELDDEGARR